MQVDVQQIKDRVAEQADRVHRLQTELAKTIKDYGFEYADLAQVNEVNRASFGDMEAVGVQWYKRHRAYKITL